MESKNYTAEELESIQHRFDSYCKKVIDSSVKNQIRGYLRYCKNYNAVPLDDEPDILGGVIDDYLFEKIGIKAGDETIYLESYQLAEAVMKIPEKKRVALLFAVVFGYSVAEVAEKLNIKKETVSDYKYDALNILKREAGKCGKERK